VSTLCTKYRTLRFSRATARDKRAKKRMNERKDDIQWTYVYSCVRAYASSMQSGAQIDRKLAQAVPMERKKRLFDVKRLPAV